jgi:tetratricopeptide (TPR) repeat protein
MADYDWVGAEQSLKRGLELNPGSFFMLDACGLMLAAQERYDEAIGMQRRGRELDPLAAVATSDLTTTLIRAGRYDEALGEARRLIEMEPAFPLAHSTLGWAHLKKGQSVEGLRELEQAVSLSPGNTLFLAQLGQAYAMTGETARARDVLTRLQAMAEERYVPPYHFAYIHTGLGEHDKAIDLLEVAVEERAGGAYGIKGSFLFTALRAHPRFLALLRTINLAP